MSYILDSQCWNELQRAILAVSLGAVMLTLVGCETKDTPKPADQPAATATDGEATPPPADAEPADDNSDFQIISVDKKKKTITFRDKRTGKTETLPMEAFYKRTAEREQARAKESGEEAPKLPPNVKEAQPEDLPSWVVVYTGAKVLNNMKAERDGKTAGQILMTTEDAPDAVATFYEKQLEGNGFTLMRTTSGEAQAMSARRKSGETVTLSINPNKETKKTNVRLAYATQ